MPAKLLTTCWTSLRQQLASRNRKVSKRWTYRPVLEGLEDVLSWFSLIWKNRLVELASKGWGLTTQLGSWYS
jgi:hypothetical protein